MSDGDIAVLAPLLKGGNFNSGLVTCVPVSIDFMSLKNNSATGPDP